jgi:hypothetical protein
MKARSAQKTWVTDGVFPTHEEPLGMTDLLERTMVALDAPVLTMNVVEKSLSHLHALFFVGRTARGASRRGFYRPFETPSQNRTHADE